MRCLVINIPSSNLRTPQFNFSLSSKDVRFSDGTFRLAVNSNSDGVISYKCNNELASVTNDGTVTFKGTGTCIITATVSATEIYNSASASYTLNICTWLTNDEIPLEDISLKNKMTAVYSSSSTTKYTCTIGGSVWNSSLLGFKVVDASKLRGKTVRFTGTPRKYSGNLSFYSPLTMSASEVKSAISNDYVFDAIFASSEDFNNSYYTQNSELEETHDIIIPDDQKILSILFNANVEETFKLVALENIV